MDCVIGLLFGINPARIVTFAVITSNATDDTRFPAIAASLLILLSLRKLSILSVDGDSELWTALFAVAFILIGIVLSRYLLRKHRPDEPLANPDLYPPDIEKELSKHGITQREYEVLKLIAEGHSNHEISNALFISESTVKTHVSNVLTKLDAKRRTQAVQKAKELRIL